MLFGAVFACLESRDSRVLGLKLKLWEIYYSRSGWNSFHIPEAQSLPNVLHHNAYTQSALLLT
jgi:hypothetical protein